jgi:hypothetical protein
VPNALLMLLAKPYLRRVLPWVSMSGGLAAAAASVAGLAWLGANNCVDAGGGFHSSTFQLNLSRFCETIHPHHR